AVKISVASTKRARRRYSKLVNFQAKMNTLYPQAPLLDPMSEAIVCQCEGVTQQDIEEAFAHGARDFRTVKLWTRAGMGICQGRSCAPGIADLLRETGAVK